MPDQTQLLGLVSAVKKVSPAIHTLMEFVNDAMNVLVSILIHANNYQHKLTNAAQACIEISANQPNVSVALFGQILLALRSMLVPKNDFRHVIVEADNPSASDPKAMRASVKSFSSRCFWGKAMVEALLSI